jgi:hypothetical protein
VSTGTITIKLYSDFGLEDDELIEITIKSVDSDNEIKGMTLSKLRYSRRADY